jgi:hypothetical protein
MDGMEKEGETMKRILVSALALSLLLAIAGPASAGDVGRATTKGILIGAGSILLLDALFRAHQPAVVYAPAPPVVYAPAPPGVYAPAPPPARWIPGHWQSRWVPTQEWRDVWVPDHYTPDGQLVQAHYERRMTQGGYYAQIWVPGRGE